MTYNTISDAVTMSGGEGALLAGRYRVGRQLGQGGMGSVWLAEDTRLDNKPFAIKMLPSILVSNKRAYRQLKGEALVAMKLVHPNIVTLRAFEENGGNPFLVMDYIDGETLDDHLAEKGKLTEDETIRILKPIAAALDYAHGEGVVHRDVKPANVMIRKDGHPYILDFGIAREIQETMTRVTGKLSSGTLLYMSPEQLNGDAPKPAQDIYSFAAMAYECLKGEPPFVRGAIEDQIKNKQPEPLTGKAVILAAGVMSGLAKKPEDRPATCTGVLELGEIVRRREDEETTERKAAASMKPLKREEAERRALADFDSYRGKDITSRDKEDGTPHSFNSARGYLIAIWIVIAVLTVIVVYVLSYSPTTRQKMDKRDLVKSENIQSLDKESAERRAEAKRRERAARDATERKADQERGLTVNTLHEEAERRKRDEVTKNAELERQPPVRRLFSFETRIIPYIIVNGGRQYVQATSEGVPGINVRTEYQGGKYYIVLGSKTLPNGAKRVKLTHGRYSAKFWVSSAMFDNNVHEVELK
jgi:serine/threonine protein kinase